MGKLITIDSINEAHNFLKMEPPKHPLVSVVRYSENMRNVVFGDHRYVINLFQVNFKSGISGHIRYGRSSYDFQEGTLVFTQPGQIVQFDGNHEEGENSDGWVLLFHPDLIRKSELGRNIHSYSFFLYEANEALHVSDSEKRSLNDILIKIEDEYNRPIDAHSQKLIVSNIELLLDYCTRYYERQFYTRSNLNKDILSRFERLLTSYFRDKKQLRLGLPTVSFCGNQLNLSPNYLSDLLKKETGKSAQDHIHHYVIETAKNTLLNTDEPVSAIAYDLGFEYPQHFSQLFKRKTNLTPTEFRSLN